MEEHAEGWKCTPSLNVCNIYVSSLDLLLFSLNIKSGNQKRVCVGPFGCWVEGLEGAERKNVEEEFNIT